MVGVASLLEAWVLLGLSTCVLVSSFRLGRRMVQPLLAARAAIVVLMVADGVVKGVVRGGGGGGGVLEGGRRRCHSSHVGEAVPGSEVGCTRKSEASCLRLA